MRLTAEAGVQADGEAAAVVVEGGRQRDGTRRVVDNLPGVHGGRGSPVA